jgi:hypothetical protein
MGLVGMYAFINPKYANAPDDVMQTPPPAIILPAQPLGYTSGTQQLYFKKD